MSQAVWRFPMTGFFRGLSSFVFGTKQERTAGTMEISTARRWCGVCVKKFDHNLIICGWQMMRRGRPPEDPSAD